MSTLELLAAYPFPISDRAVGSEAGRLQRLFADVCSEFGATVGFGKSLRNLDEVSWGAAAENWDGEGAPALDEATYAQARRFLQALPVTTPAPSISVDPDGEISMTWVRRRGSMFSVSIRRDGRLSHAGLFDSKSNYGMEFFVDEIPQAIRDNLARVFPEGAPQSA